MNLTINIIYSGQGGNARKFAQEMVSSGLVDKIRAESGNLKYEYFFPMNDEESVLLIDSWESAEALDRHHNSPLMGEIAKLREKYDLYMTVKRFTEVEADTADEKFIRKKL